MLNVSGLRCLMAAVSWGIKLTARPIFNRTLLLLLLPTSSDTTAALSKAAAFGPPENFLIEGNWQASPEPEDMVFGGADVPSFNWKM